MADIVLSPKGWSAKSIASFEEAKANGDEVIHTGKMVPLSEGSMVEQIIVNPLGYSGPSAAYRPAPAVGTIYFVGPDGGPIKIGFASRLEYRLKDLRTMNAFPLIVHAAVQGPPTVERAYHGRFAEHRLHGEWFAPHPDILAEIARINEVLS